MRRRIPALISLAAVCILAVAAAAWQTSQSSGATKAASGAVHRSASGERTVIGCVAREGEGFVLKSDQGTYEFDTARDLTPYVGKKVRISGHWRATGVTTTAPVKATTAAASDKQAPSGKDEQAPSAKKGPAKSFAGDLQLHIRGDVIGDCEQAK